jgi:hypothetical protein
MNDDREVYLRFDEPVGLFRFDGEHYPWGTPKYDDHGPIRPGIYLFEERPNPATGTPLGPAVTGPWLFLAGGTEGAARDWLVQRGSPIHASAIWDVCTREVYHEGC